MVGMLLSAMPFLTTGSAARAASLAWMVSVAEMHTCLSLIAASYSSPSPVCTKCGVATNW